MAKTKKTKGKKKQAASIMNKDITGAAEAAQGMNKKKSEQDIPGAIEVLPANHRIPKVRFTRITPKMPKLR